MHYPSSAKRASYFYTASSVICVDKGNNEGPGNLLLERKLVFVVAIFIFFLASTFFYSFLTVVFSSRNETVACTKGLVQIVVI